MLEFTTMDHGETDTSRNCQTPLWWWLLAIPIGNCFPKRYWGDQNKLVVLKVGRVPRISELLLLKSEVLLVKYVSATSWGILVNSILFLSFKPILNLKYLRKTYVLYLTYVSEKILTFSFTPRFTRPELTIPPIDFMYLYHSKYNFIVDIISIFEKNTVE